MESVPIKNTNTGHLRNMMCKHGTCSPLLVVLILVKIYKTKKRYIVVLSLASIPHNYGLRMQF